jgi:hypothetical protein
MCRSRRHLAEYEAVRQPGAERALTVVDRAPSGVDGGPAPAGGPAWDRRSGIDRTIRASDRDRETVIASLGEHTGAGRLTLAEFEERVAGVTSARTLADLDQVLVDLPVASSPRPTAPTRRRDERWRPWLMTAAICLIIWAASSVLAGRVTHFWPFWVIVPWGIVLAAGGGWFSSRRRRLVR